MTKTQSLISRAGRALYGRKWYLPMSRDLRVPDSRIRSWVIGKREPRPDQWFDLLWRLIDRKQQIEALLVETRAAATEKPGSSVAAASGRTLRL
jgi:hypothetical protein